MRVSVVIWPDSATHLAVNEVRARYDAHYRLIGPHITVAFPDERQASMDETRDLVASVASKTQPFTVKLTRWMSIDELLASYGEETRFLIERYPNAVNAIFLMASEGSPEMVRLRRDLSRAIEQPALLVEYPPYMCIGQSLSDAAHERAMQELATYEPDYGFPAKSIDLLEEQPDGSWSVVATVPLGKQSTGAESEGGTA